MMEVGMTEIQFAEFWDHYIITLTDQYSLFKTSYFADAML